MKSDHLNRKSHLKRLHSYDSVGPRGTAGGAGATRVYDLSHSDASAATLISGSGTQTPNVAIRVTQCYWPISSLLAQIDETDAALSKPVQSSFSNDHDVMLWCATLAQHSPTMNALLRDAADMGWAIGLDDLGREGYYIDTAEQVVLFDRCGMDVASLGRSAFFRNALVTTFTRALRDVWHEDRMDGAEEDFAPDQYLMLERIRAADCDTVTIFAGWELRGAGFPDVWRHILGSEEGDMATVFTRFLERDPGALFNGAALAYTFRQWYADLARVDACDHETLEVLDALYLSGDVDAEFTAEDCGDARVTPAVVEGLAILPDGTAYLSGLGDGILRDPFFAGLNDPINQTHLFHIMYDMEVVMVNNVPFRDVDLARRIFPEGDLVRPAISRF